VLGFPVRPGGDGGAVAAGHHHWYELAQEVHGAFAVSGALTDTAIQGMEGITEGKPFSPGEVGASGVLALGGQALAGAIGSRLGTEGVELVPAPADSVVTPAVRFPPIEWDAPGITSDPVVAPQVSSPRLQNIVNNLYKGGTNPSRFGNGTTMDAIRNELVTGRPTNGTWHLVMGAESAQGITNWLVRNTGAPHYDRLVARSILDDLRAAFSANGGFPW
jgi:hypothetical protein